MKKSELAKEMADILLRIKRTRPLIHCITNYVAANDSANMLLAIGASPIMADCSEEASDIAAGADGLLLNLGIPNPDKLHAMRLAGETANRFGKPIVFDPVGIGASSFRKEASAGLLKAVQVQIIRANASEMRELCGLHSHAAGVDAAGENGNKALAETAARKFGCVAAVTGKSDFVSDGKRTVCLKNGHADLSRLTGTGCMSSAVTAAFLSRANDPLAAACAGIAFLGICGEIAAAYAAGMGGFHSSLLDAAGNLTADIFLERLCLELLE